MSTAERGLELPHTQTRGGDPAATNLLSNVSDITRLPIKYGGFADIYRGGWEGRTIALKMLKIQIDAHNFARVSVFFIQFFATNPHV